MPRLNSPVIGLALVALAGTLAVWRPWANPPELPVVADVESTPAQQAAAAAAQILSPKPPRAPASARVPLLVLPFENASGDTAQGYLSDGLTQELIGTLTRNAGLGVMASPTALAFKGRPASAAAADPSLGVLYILETSARRHDGRLVLEARLVDASGLQTIWSERHERPMSEVFMMLEALAERIIGTVAPAARRRDVQRAQVANADRLEAFELTLNARQHRLAINQESALAARRLLERAVERDPRYLPAYLLLHHVFNELFLNPAATEFDSPATAQRMLDIASAAVAIDPADPMARAKYAESLTLVGQHGTAVAQIDAVVSANTTDTDLLNSAATVTGRAGDFERARGFMKRIARLDPVGYSVRGAAQYAGYLYLQGNYAESADITGLCIRQTPSARICRLWHAAALAQTGKLDEARSAAADLRGQDAEPTVRSEIRRMGIGYRDPEHARHYGEGLRKAGLQE